MVLTRPSGEGDCRPNVLIRPLRDEFPAFRLCVALCRGRVQTVYDLTEIDKGSLRERIEGYLNEEHQSHPAEWTRLVVTTGDLLDRELLGFPVKRDRHVRI